MFRFGQNITFSCSKKMDLLFRKSCDRGKIVNSMFRFHQGLEAGNDEGWSRQTPSLCSGGFVGISLFYKAVNRLLSFIL